MAMARAARYLTVRAALVAYLRRHHRDGQPLPGRNRTVADVVNAKRARFLRQQGAAMGAASSSDDDPHMQASSMVCTQGHQLNIDDYNAYHNQCWREAKLPSSSTATASSGGAAASFTSSGDTSSITHAIVAAVTAQLDERLGKLSLALLRRVGEPLQMHRAELRAMSRSSRTSCERTSRCGDIAAPGRAFSRQRSSGEHTNGDGGGEHAGVSRRPGSGGGGASRAPSSRRAGAERYVA